MRDIDILKNLNIWEKIGFFIKKNPKKAITIMSAFIASLIFIAFIPTIVSAVQENTARKYLDKTNNKLEEYAVLLDSSKDTLETNKVMYKDYDIYFSEIDKYNTEHNGLVDTFNGYEKEFENKNIKYILKNFSYYKDKSKTRILFPNIVNESFDKFSIVSSDINEVYTLDTTLLANTKKFNTYLKDVETEQNKRYDNLNKVLSNGKNERVKEISNKLFKTINGTKLNYISTYEKTPSFVTSDEGKYNLEELRTLNSNHNILLGVIDTFKTNLTSFDNYYAELNTQYYTVIVAHDYDKSVDYITENNPSFSEWTETETYTDTETYTERVYAGSRIVNGEQQDYYETVTKTRPVTKTRTVLKNNGQPRTIEVPYDVYKFYYSVEKHTPNGIEKTKEYVGKKHEKYDFSIRTWDYKKSEEIGYTVWKQLWNDNEGIVKGKNIDAYLE